MSNEPPYFSTFKTKVFATLATRSFASSSFSFKVAFCLSNNDICNTFSTKKPNRLVSSLITPEMCLNTSGLFVMSESFSICAANEMVETGVFSSCVMLLMKSFFISDSFFWRKTMKMVNTKVISRISEKITDGTMKLIELCM